MKFRIIANIDTVEITGKRLRAQSERCYLENSIFIFYFRFRHKILSFYTVRRQLMPESHEQSPRKSLNDVNKNSEHIFRSLCFAHKSACI